MNPKEINWNKLLRYVRGNSSHKEQKEVGKWVNSSSKNRNIIFFLEEMWQSSAEDKEEWDVDSAWMRYKFRYGKDFKEVTRENDKFVPEFQKKKITATESSKYNTISWGVVAVAAALVCLIVIYGYPSQKASVSDVSPMKEIVTNQEQRIHFRLSDGTKLFVTA